MAAFAAYQLLEGDVMAEAFATNTEIGGRLAAAPEHGLEPACGLFAGALPAAGRDGASG